jgi:ATP-dependent Lhr-like helicase
VLEGGDVLILAGTGSGKTEAVLAPLAQRWLPAMRREGGCTILYVTPTRALANDLLRRIEPPMEALGLRVGVRHGERNDLSRARKPDLLITTPESLDVLLTGRDAALQSVRGVVLDEIHLLYNTQRGFQLGVLLKRLDAFTGTVCQVVGLSATVATQRTSGSFSGLGVRLSRS